MVGEPHFDKLRTNDFGRQDLSCRFGYLTSTSVM